MSKILDFSELLITKFCHDISGQVGAVDNGIEILQEGGEEIHNKALQLVANSSAELVSKLKYYRIAYGFTKQEGEADLQGTKNLIDDYFKHSKIRVNWEMNKPDYQLHNLTHQGVKLLINLLIVVSSYLIYGGEITVSISKNHKNKVLIVHGKNSNIKQNTDAELILINHEMREIKVSNVQIHLTAKIASELGVIFEYEHKSDHVIYKAEFANSSDE